MHFVDYNNYVYNSTLNHVCYTGDHPFSEFVECHYGKGHTPLLHPLPLPTVVVWPYQSTTVYSLIMISYYIYIYIYIYTCF